MADQPLGGLNIVVTRPREQATQIAQSIHQAGGNAILFPLLEISSLPDPQPLRELIGRLPEFDLAIFISPNAVRYGMEAILASGSLPQGLKIAAVGQGSARALQGYDIRDIIAPQGRSDSEALLALPELQQVEGRRVVIFRGEAGRELLGETLKARGATVAYAACYRRSKPQQAISALFAACPDALTVTSSEALGYLWDLSEPAEKAQLVKLPLFVPHPRIAEAAIQLGWRDVVATAGGDDGLLAGLLAWAGIKSGRAGGK